jgi:arylsulfatase
MFGDHALYHDGWIASTKVMRPPWQVAGAVNRDPASYPYELYHVDEDWTQAVDLAERYPAKVRELDRLFWEEARKYQVLPLDASVATRVVAPRPNLAAGRTRFAWSGRILGTPNGDAPSILNASFTYTAEVEVPQGGAHGMIVTQGGRFGGYGLYLLGGRPVFVYNFLDLERARWESSTALAPGRHRIEFDFKYDGLGAGTLAFNDVSGVGRGGTGVLRVDGREVQTQHIAHTVPFIFQWDETFDIGADTGTPVAEDYRTPFELTARLTRLTLAIERPQLTPEDEQKLRRQDQMNRASQ